MMTMTLLPEGYTAVNDLRLAEMIAERDRLRQINAELVAALKSARLMLYAWKAVRHVSGVPDNHAELNGAIAEAETALAKARQEAET